MFNKANDMEHLVEKHHWDKIKKKLPTLSPSDRVTLAAACGKSSDEDALNLLMELLEDKNEAVVMQAVKSLGDVGRDNAKTHLLALLEKLPEGNEPLKAVIKESISKINIAKRR